ncbi:MAG TPA: alpha/beta hydrolase [Candidatus Eisenbergiella merdipullorum]|uniref:Alpha/beta hydrolase n=1 Tax=Candidatus Eisenbergiella merdipullorum TaxID=2838553 RepID=A0A9D2KZ42_9FIRM|nr:alpha/beta hydrolase [Candidatus Eisenbergiella merdipullorum]
MIVKTIPIRTDHTQAALTTYFQDQSPELGLDRKRPVVLICPGGGYGFLSDREAEPVALRMCGAGFHACVLRYSIAPETFPASLWELAASVAWLREHAEEYHIDEKKIVVCGFSAGAHLAGSIGVFWNRDFLSELTGLSAGQMRPDRLILCYPVITSGKYAHMGSFESLLGKESGDEKKREFVSLEKQVTPDMPKTFLWHTFADQAVPVENSLLLAEAMRSAGVPFELHIFPDGEHGLSLADEQTDCGKGEQIVPECTVWPALAIDWIRRD